MCHSGLKVETLARKARNRVRFPAVESLIFSMFPDDLKFCCLHQRWKKLFRFWEPTFTVEKFLQNFASCKISNYLCLPTF